MLTIFQLYVYASHLQGDLAASVLEGGLVNDHVRVLFGEVRYLYLQYT